MRTLSKTLLRAASFALLGLVPNTSWAVPETIQISFDLAQYSHDGFLSFSRGCVATPPTGRNNYVHITVVWLEDAAGNYVTTLHRWGRTYPYNLKAWALSSNMAVDGITSATPTSDGNMPAMVFRSFSTGVHDISWLPDGDYRIRLETTQCELADEFRSGTTPLFGPEATFTFTKDRTSRMATLGSSSPFNNVTINYTVPMGNIPPGAWAGVDQRLMPSLNPSEETTMLNGVVDDDSGNTPAVSWQQVRSEPSGLTAQIASPSSAQTAVTFSTAGIYTFRLTATDGGGLSSSDEVEVWVNAHTLSTTHDAEVARGQPNVAMGIIENSGPWVFVWGQCGMGQNYSRGYLRFDVSSIPGAITHARLRLPRGETTPNNAVHHDFYLLSDAQDDWNGGNNSTDWEASVTFNNQSVPMGQASNLDAQQLIGTWQHDECRWRHLFSDPDQPDGPGSECPGWIDVDLDLATVAAFDSNDQWSIFITTRQGCNNSLGIGSDENLINPSIVVVEHWQSTVNQAPAANAGPDRVVTDQLPSGTELVTLDGSASTDDSGIVSYAWREGGQLLGSSAMPTGVTVPLALGVHDLQLTVTDGAGLTATDDVQIVLEDRFHPNRSSAAAAVIDGDPNGKLYADLFAYTEAPGGDWYAIDVVDGTSLTVGVEMAGGDLDVALHDSTGAELMRSASGGTTEMVSGQALAAGRYFVQVSAAPGGASTYEMTVDVDGASLTVALDPASAVESAGTLAGAGTVSIPDAAAQAVTVTLTADLPQHLRFGSGTVTIPQGMTSATFDILLTDDPPGAPDANRYVNITATAPNYNRGSAVFEILDDEASLVVTWDKAAETIAETRSPLVLLTAQLSGTAASPVTVPFTLGGTAELGTDYEISGGITMVTINGSTRATIPIAVFDNPEVEQAETVVIRMGTPTGATPGSITEYILTINDDDGTVQPGADGGTGGDPGAVEGSGCGCSTAGAGVSWVGILTLLVFVLRRRD